MDDGLVLSSAETGPALGAADGFIFEQDIESSRAIRERPLHAPPEEVFFAGYDP
jgi:hypothetical protein